MQDETTGPTVGKIGFKAQPDTAEGDLVPGNVGLRKKSSLKAFGPWPEIGILQTAAIEKVDLTDGRQVNERKQSVDLDARASFFSGLTNGRLKGRLAVLHKPGRQRPETVARFDGASTKQNVALPFDNAADDQLGVLVVDGGAIGADVAGMRVAGRDTEFDRRTTLGAEIHGGQTVYMLRILYDW